MEEILRKCAEKCRTFDVKIVAFGCKEGVGKDTAGGILSSWGYTRLFFAEGVYACAGDIQRRIGAPVVKTPALLQLLGDGIRKIYGDNIWVSALATKMSEEIDRGNRKFVITDLRHKIELQFLLSCGAKTYRILRKNRQLTRDPQHISEVDLDDTTMDEIENDGSVDDLMAILREKIEISIGAI